MTPSKILRIAVIAEIALIPVGFGVSFWADSFLPSDVVTLEENQNTAFTDFDSIGPRMIAFLVAALAISGAWIASIIGLLKLKRWGAWLYLCTAFLGLPIYFMAGFTVWHPIHQIFYDILRLIPGFIIGLAFFSGAIPKETAKALHPTAGNAPV